MNWGGMYDELKCFDEEHKLAHREEQFPKDLELAFQVGAGRGQTGQSVK